MLELRTARTADLSDGSAAAIRELLDGAFGKVSEDTYQNVLGGVHALLVEDGELIGHASVVQRRMLHGGRALRTGYIEGVAVRAGGSGGAGRSRRSPRMASVARRTRRARSTCCGCLCQLTCPGSWSATGGPGPCGRTRRGGRKTPEPVVRPGYRARVTLGLDILLLNIDPNLRRVREREYAGYAMRAADLIELAVAGRVTLTGRWVKWVTVVDAEPTGEPLLDSSLAALASAPKRLMPVDWMCQQPAGGVVEAGLAVLAGQGAVRLHSREVTRRLTLTEPELLDPARQAQIRTRLDRYIAAGSAADVLDWAFAGDRKSTV